jgi:hypothetical protein
LPVFVIDRNLVPAANNSAELGVDIASRALPTVRKRAPGLAISGIAGGSKFRVAFAAPETVKERGIANEARNKTILVYLYLDDRACSYFL